MLHERQSSEMNKSSSIYMSYLMIEAGIVLAIVLFQVKVMLKMLRTSSVV
jgi:spore germination protein GerM